MNPGYVRIALPQGEAASRFRRWIAAPELAVRRVRTLDAVKAASDGGRWLGDAVTVFEADGWTLFEDLSGVLCDRFAEEWLRLAENDALVFASYNDALPVAELVVIEEGKIVRELRDDPAAPGWRRNVGRLPEEASGGGAGAWTGWVEIARFVDSDDVFGAQPDEVELWIFEARDGSVAGP